MHNLNAKTSNGNLEAIIQHCKNLLKKDDRGVAKEDRTHCTESGCTGRAVAFDFIKSGMIDKINSLLVKEMETKAYDKQNVLKLFRKFKTLRLFRKEIETSAKKRNLPTLIQLFFDLDVISYLYKVSFNFDNNIEQSVLKFPHAIESYKEKLHMVENQILEYATHDNIKIEHLRSSKSNQSKLKGTISQGYEAYKYLLQQLVCIKAYVYQGNNPFNQKRPAMSHTANLLGYFAAGDKFILARETILPTIGIIARDAGHTKCSAISIIELTALIQQCIDQGLFSGNFMNTPEGEDFLEMFMNAMGFISDSVNKTKSGKAAYIAVHLAKELLNQWKTKAKTPSQSEATLKKMARFDGITTQMACELYRGNVDTFQADTICQNPEVKIERPNFYNPDRQDQVRYGMLFSTEPTLLDCRTFKSYYGINNREEFENLLGSNQDPNPIFSLEAGKSLDDCTIRITLGDIDNIIDKPLDALVQSNPDNFEEVKLNKSLLSEVLKPENRGKHNEILIPEYQKRYETQLAINSNAFKKSFLLDNLISTSYYHVLADVEELISQNGLRVLHKINLKRTLYEAGSVEIPKCTVFIVGCDHLHAQALGQDPYASLLLPVNVVVMEQGEKTRLFAFDPKLLCNIKELEISKDIIERLRRRIQNIVLLRQDHYDEKNIETINHHHSALRQKNNSYAISKTFAGVNIQKVLDKILFVSKASKFGKELSQLGLVNLYENQTLPSGNTSGELFFPILGKLEAIAEDVKQDPSVLAIWPYRLSISRLKNNRDVMVSAINPMAISKATGNHNFKSFSKDITRRLYSTIEDAQSELSL